MTTRTYLAVGLAFVTVAATATLAASDGPDTVAGFYQSSGVNANGVEYHGLVQIAAHGDSFLLLWWPSPHDAGAALTMVPEAAGIGIVRGNVFAASFYGENRSGVIVYLIESDGRLVGRWAQAGGDGSVYSEVLTKIAVSPIPPKDDEEDVPGSLPVSPTRPVMLPLQVASK